MDEQNRDLYAGIAVKADTFGKTPEPRSKRYLLVALTAVLLLAVVGGVTIWDRQHSADAAVAKSAPKPILRLAGSNTIGDTLGPALAEAFLKDQGATEIRILPGANPQEKIVEGFLPGEHTASTITIAAHGSATAFTALAGDNCDIGMASRKIKPEEAAKLSSLGEMASAANEHVLGLDGIAVIVNAANPADLLDKDKIMRIFTGEITDWSQVGAFSGAINIYARDDKSGTYDTFKNLVLAGKPLAAGAQRIEDSKALSDAVAADPHAIGFIGLPYIQSAKPIAVSEKGTQALLPTRLTVGTEDYLLSRRLYLYTSATPANKYTRQFIDFALSRQGQDVVGSSGFVAQNVAQVAQTVSSEAPPEYRSLTKDANRLSLDFRFQSGQTDLDNKAKVDLDRVVSLIADLKIPAERIMLFGFSDSIGSPSANQALSLNRAKAVQGQFVQRGMDPAIVRGYGSGLAVASDVSDEGQARNRRVEIWVKK
ncbi:MAG: phosphate ABC transporter substrate-binding/OmpA family protein [Terracidiphilus sp.]|jgi:phosphate transport system substrate-binding protein